MSFNDQVLDLLLRYEEAQARGQTVTPEELCRDSPELLPEVQRRIRRLQAMDQLLQEGETDDSTLPSPRDPENSTAPVDLPGYEILGELGRGGMGVVWKARHVKLHRLVALKMIRAGDYAGPDQRERFRREAEAVARLQHPNIVQIYEVGEHRGQPYVALEFVEGGSLARKLAGTPLPPQQAAALTETLARAVQAAHDRDIVHRDLKPANVLLTRDGTPKLTDFGLAKRLDVDSGQTRSWDMLGTPSYMAPEQAGSARRIGPLVDVYALGAVFYELLTGRPPFRGATLLDTLQQVRHNEPVAPRQLQPGVPRDLETICLKCLQKEPGKRYASAQAVAEDLRRFQAGEPIQARPVSRTERAVKWVRRRPLVAALLAAVFLTTAVGTAVSLSLAILASRRADQADANAQQAQKNEKEARRNALLAEEKAAEATAAREEAEATLVDGLLRLIGHKSGPLDPLEEDALWKLARSKDPVRIRFVADGVARPATARRLTERRDLVMHATAGLDLGRRRQIGQVLTRRLRDPDAGPPVREACVLLGAALPVQDEGFAAPAAVVIVEAIGQTPDTETTRLETLARTLRTFSDQLSAAQADSAAQALLGRLDKTTNPYAFRPLVKALVAVLEKCGPEPAQRHADQAARILLARMEQTKDPGHLSWQAGPLKSVLEKLPPEQARRYADQAIRSLLARLSKPTNGPALWTLSEAVEKLSALLSSEQADSHTRALVAQLGQNTNQNTLIPQGHALYSLSERLSGEPARQLAAALLPPLGRATNRYTLEGLGHALAVVSAKLTDEPARQHAEAIVAQMNATTNPLALGLLASALTAMADNLRGEPARSCLDRAAQVLVTQMSQTTNVFLLGSLANPLSALLKKLPAEQAQRHADKIAQGLLAQMEKANEMGAGPLATLLHPIAGHLSREQAQAAARVLLARIEKTTNPFVLGSLANPLGAMAAQLSDEQADTAAQLLLARISKSTDVHVLSPLGSALQAVAARLRGEPARKHAEAVVALLGRINDPDALGKLAGVLGVLAEKIGPDLARRHAEKAAEALVARMTAANMPFALRSLAEALKAVAGGVGAEAARQHLPALLTLMRRARDTDSLPPLTEAVKALASRLPAEQGRPHLETAARIILARALPALPGGAERSAFALKRIAESLQTQMLVELLKSPLCVGRVREVVLSELGRRGQREFQTVWDFVAWAGEHEPGLDLRSPPLWRED